MTAEIFLEYWEPLAGMASGIVIFFVGLLAGRRRKKKQDNITDAMIADFEAEERAIEALHRHLAEMLFEKYEPTIATVPVMSRIEQAFLNSTMLPKYPFPLAPNDLRTDVRWTVTRDEEPLLALLIYAELGYVMPLFLDIGKHGDIND